MNTLHRAELDANFCHDINLVFVQLFDLKSQLPAVNVAAVSIIIVCSFIMDPSDQVSVSLCVARCS